MSKLTELMKQIPLDELMGDTDQVTESTENHNRKQMHRQQQNRR